jgi:hypothetical protein
MLSGMSSRKAAAVLATVFAIGFANVASAQQPSPAAVAAAKEIMSIKGAQAMFDPVVRGVVETVKRMVLQTNLALQKDINEVSAQLQREFEPRVSQVMDEMARLYAVKFSDQEMKELLAFYRSPLGRKMVVEEPKVLDQSMAFGSTWADKLATEVLDRFRGEMKKRGHDI